MNTAEIDTVISGLNALGNYSQSAAIQSLRHGWEKEFDEHSKARAYIEVLKAYQYRDRFVLGFIAAFVLHGVTTFVANLPDPTQLPFVAVLGCVLLGAAALGVLIAAIIVGLKSWTPPKSPT